jgi:hypothetical protein
MIPGRAASPRSTPAAVIGPDVFVAVVLVVGSDASEEPVQAASVVAAPATPTAPNALSRVRRCSISWLIDPSAARRAISVSSGTRLALILRFEAPRRTGVADVQCSGDALRHARDCDRPSGEESPEST